MKFIWIFSGAVLSFGITFAAVFIIALAEYYTGLGEGTAQICAYVSAAAGVFVGAVFSAKKAHTKVILNAMPIAVIYIAAIIAASLILKHEINTDIHCMSLFAGIIFSGFLGAVCSQPR